MKRLLSVIIVLICTFCLAVNVSAATGDVWQITLHTNGGTFSYLPETYTEGESTGLADYGEKPGYDFGGWYTSPDFSTDPIYYIPDWMTGDIELWAEWIADGEPEPEPEPVYYTVTFETNGGTSIDSIKVKEGETIRLALMLRRAGYTFAGWFTDNGTFQEQVFIGRTKITSDVTLYAKWEALKHTVTFETNGGSSIDSITVETDKTIGNIPPPSRDGYVFSGWFFDNETFGREVFLDSTPIVSSITIYAKWKSEIQDIPASPVSPSENITIKIPEVTVTYPIMFKSGRAVAYLNEDGSVTAGLNHTGSVNSETTIAALKEAIRMARANGKQSVKIIIPKEAIGFSERTADKIRKEAKGFKVEFEIEFTEDLTGTLELTENVGQVLTDIKIARVHRDYDNISSKLTVTPQTETPIIQYLIFEAAQIGDYGETIQFTADLDNLLIDLPEWQPIENNQRDIEKLQLIPITIADGVMSFSTDSGWFILALDGTVIENVNL